MQTSKILVHQSVHFDEAVGVFLARKHGEQKYPGLSTAQVRLVQHDPVGGDERFVREGMYPIGCGRGKCDDKGPDGKRKQGKCSALLVAEDLGIDKDPVYQKLLAETLMCDSKSGVRATQLPELIKMSNACFGRAGEEFVLRWATGVVGAIVEQCANGYTSIPHEKGAVEMFERFVKEKKFSNEKAVKYIRKQLLHGQEHKDSVTELDFVCRAMQRCGKADDAKELALFALSRLYEVQIRMQELVAEYKARGRTAHGKSEQFLIRALLGGRERTLRAIFIHSDEALAQRATTYLGYDLTVVRRSTHNVQLFANNRVEHLSLGTATALLRWLDGDNSVKSLPFEELSTAGEVPGVSHWHYFKSAEWLLNGSATHTDVPATHICSQAIIDVLGHAFHPREIGIWKAERGVVSRRKSNQQNPRQNQRGKDPALAGVSLPSFSEVAQQLTPCLGETKQ